MRGHVSFCRCHSDLYYDFGCSFDYHCVFVDEDQEFGHKNKAMFLNQQTNKQTQDIAQKIWEITMRKFEKRTKQKSAPVIKTHSATTTYTPTY